MPSGAVTIPPAAATRAWPAATSHSQVVARRGYMSALPSAIRQNLIAEPHGTRVIGPSLLTNLSVAESIWERLTTATGASGHDRVLIASARSASPPDR